MCALETKDIFLDSGYRMYNMCCRCVRRVCISKRHERSDNLKTSQTLFFFGDMIVVMGFLRLYQSQLRPVRERP